MIYEYNNPGNTMLKEQLKTAGAKTKTIAIDNMTFLVCGLSRTAKNKLSVEARKNGETDNELFEALLLAACVCDPSTGQPLMPDYREWDIPAHISEPLVQACIDVCGFTAKKDSDETVKN